MGSPVFLRVHVLGGGGGIHCSGEHDQMAPRATKIDIPLQIIEIIMPYKSLEAPGMITVYCGYNILFPSDTRHLSGTVR
jgi:hypothetical protein